MDQIILFGDSITQQSFDQERGFGAGAALSNAYVRRLDIVNRGMSGYNTDQALIVLPKVIPSPAVTNVRLLTVFFGANDSRSPNSHGPLQQHVPVERFAKNLEAIVTHPCVRAHKDIRILLVTTPPVDERKFRDLDRVNRPDLGPEAPTRRTSTNAALYAEAVRRVGAAVSGVEVLDLWTAMMQRAGYDGAKALPGSEDAPLNETLQEYLHDGLHFSGAAYRFLFEELTSTIERVWPELAPHRIPFALPAWDNEDGWKKEGIRLGPAL